MRRPPAGRPHFFDTMNALAEAVRGSATDAERLRAVLHELSFRKTHAARALEREIRTLLASSGSNGSDPPPATPNEAENTAVPMESLSPRVERPRPPSRAGQPQSAAASPRLPGSAGTESRRSTAPGVQAGRLVLRRRWLRRLLGARPIVIELSPDCVRVCGRRPITISRGALARVALRRRRFGADLYLEAAEGGQPWRLPSCHREDVVSAACAIAEYGFAAPCAEQCGAFEQLLASDGYLNRRRVDAWRVGAETLSRDLMGIRDAFPSSTGDNLDDPIQRFWSILARFDEIVSERNDRYVQVTAREFENFFATLERNPLTPAQVDAVLRDEDHCLVVAGAGTGKTSTVVGKVAFLLRSGTVAPDEVLALAFARKAKAEMEERIRDRAGVAVEVRTFHSLGRQIVTAVEGEKSAIASMAEHEKEYHFWIAEKLSSLLSDPGLREKYVNFVAHHRYPARYLEDFASRDEYLQYMRKQEPMTLRGERVKSFEELLIADWLTLNGIRYEYERPYAEEKTSNSRRRQYKPDFYLVDYGIYLEHFGVGRDGSTAPGIDPMRYAEGMRWKRQLHSRRRTKLIESYSWERKEGILLAELVRKLRQAGVEIRPLSDRELREIIEHPKVKERLVALLGDFLKVFKANLWSLPEVRGLASAGGPAADRSTAFLELFEPVYRDYEDNLRRRQEVDFSDLIAKATAYVESGAYTSRFRRIIVDEFQDISRGRQRLLLALLRRSVDEDVRLFCVGDDWQSIFGFTGSDVGIMTGFPNVFGYTRRTDLDLTFRFNDRLLDATSRFIHKNPAQLRKSLRSRRTVDAPAIRLIDGDHVNLAAVLCSIDAEVGMRSRASVLLLGRYNHCEPDDLEALTRRHPRLDLSFLTVHKAKGLEADYVVLLDVCCGRFGFPSEIASDPILDLVVPTGGSFEYAEERRVFYVALTRARHKAFVIASPQRRSTFVQELLAPEYRLEVDAQGFESPEPVRCPECQAGTLVLKFPARAKGYAWRCTFEPYCDGAARMCPTCQKQPLLYGDRISRCADPRCASPQPPRPGHRRSRTTARRLPRLD